MVDPPVPTEGTLRGPAGGTHWGRSLPVGFGPIPGGTAPLPDPGGVPSLGDEGGLRDARDAKEVSMAHSNSYPKQWRTQAVLVAVLGAALAGGSMHAAAAVVGPDLGAARSFAALGGSTLT